MNAMKTIVITGIDGSGKSVVAKRLHDKLSGCGMNISLVECPEYHASGIDTPLNKLSLALDLFSSRSDEIQSYALKSVAMFLQMTLFGPIVEYIQAKENPEQIILSRHALFDTLVYGQIYRELLNGGWNFTKNDLTNVREFINAAIESGYEQIENLIRTENERLGIAVTLESYCGYLEKLFYQNNECLIESLIKHFQTTVPDTVIILDYDVETVYRRIERRSSDGKEMHETQQTLEKLRELYTQTVSYLENRYHDFSVHQIQGSKRSIDDIVSLIIDRLSASDPAGWAILKQ
ncbi:MAG: hypothetical protein V6Z89_19500 [Desulfobacter sp.]